MCTKILASPKKLQHWTPENFSLHLTTQRNWGKKLLFRLSYWCCIDRRFSLCLQPDLPPPYKYVYVRFHGSVTKENSYVNKHQSGLEPLTYISPTDSQHYDCTQIATCLINIENAILKILAKRVHKIHKILKLIKKWLLTGNSSWQVSYVNKHDNQHLETGPNLFYLAWISRNHNIEIDNLKHTKRYILPYVSKIPTKTCTSKTQNEDFLI